MQERTQEEGKREGLENIQTTLPSAEGGGRKKEEHEAQRDKANG